jgi:hypothetical protein
MALNLPLLAELDFYSADDKRMIYKQRKQLGSGRS